MLEALSADSVVVSLEPRRASVRRLRYARRAGSWLLLTGWIVLPLMPVLALGLSKFLGLEF